MQHYKFQVPENSKLLRGQIFSFLYKHCDVKTITKSEEIEKDRYLAFSHPFDDWVFDAITKDKSINFFHIDNGYIGNHKHKRPMHYRISYNSLQNTVVRPVKESRRKLLELDDSLWGEWNADGDYNLLVMPNQSNIFRYMGQDYDSWRTKTIKYYEGQGPLVIREKIGKRKQRWQEILPMIKKAKKVITYHSMAAVESLCLGKPIEILGQSAVQHWNNQFGFDRMEMLEHIAWSQFSRDDYEDGTAWRCTFKYQVKR
tara:strand:+ start:1146 stop:1916 length:771 start_codon:yes stop_codon:yes gene_type:complete